MANDHLQLLVVSLDLTLNPNHTAWLEGVAQPINVLPYQRHHLSGAITEGHRKVRASTTSLPNVNAANSETLFEVSAGTKVLDPRSLLGVSIRHIKRRPD
jgi:hypothetical protein